MKRTVPLLALAVLLAPALGRAADSAKIKGWISDSMCGAKHAGSGAECVKKCVKEMGSAPVFVDEEKKQVWAIDNPDSVKDYLGDHVTVTASADAGKKSVHIEAVAKAN